MLYSPCMKATKPTKKTTSPLKQTTTHAKQTPLRKSHPFMSEKNLRRRIMVNRGIKPPPHRRSAQLPSSSTSSDHRQSRGRSTRPTKSVKTLQRCKSEPTLFTVDSSLRVGDDHRDLTSPDDVLYRPLTCTDIFSPPELVALSPHKFVGYDKESKVVVNVTVEGSPGPVRAMVKLGSSVDDTIRLVMERYSKEGRTPRLPDKHSSSAFELHHSYFSLQGLDKSEMIGDVGSRSFYLRRKSCKDDIAMIKPNIPPQLHVFLRGFICGKMKILIRKTRKLWKFLGCLH